VWLGAFAPSHTSLVVQQFLAEKSIPVINHPPYSPDLAPNDFWLFPTLKTGLKGTRFATMEDIECDDRTPRDSKRSLPPVLPTMAGSVEQVCVCVQRSYFEVYLVNVVICLTIKVLYHISGNFMTVPHIYIYIYIYSRRW
jgi:hypothetical protein